jgi:hypothetical protein
MPTQYPPRETHVQAVPASRVLRLNAEQNDPGSFKWASTLNGDVPEVFVKRQHNAGLGFRQIS